MIAAKRAATSVWNEPQTEKWPALAPIAGQTQTWALDAFPITTAGFHFIDWPVGARTQRMWRLHIYFYSILRSTAQVTFYCIRPAAAPRQWGHNLFKKSHKGGSAGTRAHNHCCMIDQNICAPAFTTSQSARRNFKCGIVTLPKDCTKWMRSEFHPV